MIGNGRSGPYTDGEHGRGGDPPSEGAQICCCGNKIFVKIGFGANANVMQMYHSTVLGKLD